MASLPPEFSQSPARKLTRIVAAFAGEIRGPPISGSKSRVDESRGPPEDSEPTSIPDRDAAHRFPPNAISQAWDSPALERHDRAALPAVLDARWMGTVVHGAS